MQRIIFICLGLILMLGCGVAIAAWPQGRDLAREQFSAQQMKLSYGRIRAGITPVSQLGELGFDTGTAQKLSYLGAMEQFMPSNSFDFDTLDPAVQDCFEDQGRCTAFIFSLPQAPAARVVLLVEGGRVAYKAISGFDKLTAAKKRVRFAAD